MWTTKAQISLLCQSLCYLLSWEYSKKNFIHVHIKFQYTSKSLAKLTELNRLVKNSVERFLVSQPHMLISLKLCRRWQVFTFHQTIFLFFVCLSWFWCNSNPPASWSRVWHSAIWVTVLNDVELDNAFPWPHKQSRWHCPPCLILAICLLVSSANFCKQFGNKSGTTEHQAWPGSKLFDTLMVFLK